MSSSMLLGLFDWIGDFFKSLFNLIPKIIYLLYASLACIIDVLQLFFRKLAGLDVYYVDGKAVTGDLVGNFIRGIFGMYDRSNITYSALATVFYSMLVFGIIICFASVLIAIIKSHYTYDEKSAKGPMQYVYTGVKSIINMVAVPIIVVMGLYVSNALLNALDTITSVNSGTVESLYGRGANELIKTETASGAKTVIYYDMFGYASGCLYGVDPIGTGMDFVSTLGGWMNGNGWTWPKALALIASKNQSFSGSMFRVAAYNGNRARLGQLRWDGACTGNSKDSDFTLFTEARDNGTLAEMIDTAFACNLHCDKWFLLKYSGTGVFSSPTYFGNFHAIGTNTFSKFNVGLVWYYYDLWQFNFIVGFAGIIVCVSIFINIIMGLMVRFFMCVTLFLVAPPLFGLAPLDGGSAGKKWRENFMKQALMTYGAVVGMNLMMMILPYLYEIDFFNIPLIDLLAQSLFIIVGLVTIKAVIALMSDLIGAADANKTGGDIAKEVGSVAGKAANMTLGAAKIGAKVGGNLTMAGIKGTAALGGKMAGAIEKGRAQASDKKSKLHSNNATALTAQSAEALRKGQEDKAIIGNASNSQLEQIQSMRSKGQNDGDIEAELIRSHGMDAQQARKLLGATQGLDLSKGKADVQKQATARASQKAAALREQAAAERHASVQASVKSKKQYSRAAGMTAWAGRRAAGAGNSFFGKDTGKVDEKGRKIRTGGFVGGLKAAPEGIGDLGKKGLAGGDFVKSTSDSFTEIDKKKAKEQAANIKASAQASSRIAAEMEYSRRSAGMSEEEKKKLAKELGLDK